LWRFEHPSEGGVQLEIELFGPSIGPPGKCAALVGPIAILFAVPTLRWPLASMIAWVPGAFWLATPSSAIAKLENVTVAAVAKIKNFILGLP
jgi:hypothetical protein